MTIIRIRHYSKQDVSKIWENLCYTYISVSQSTEGKFTEPKCSLFQIKHEQNIKQRPDSTLDLKHEHKLKKKKKNHRGYREQS